MHQRASLRRAECTGGVRTVSRRQGGPWTRVARRGFGHVLIDRTGFVSGAADRLTVQRVPPAIYDASYPCWFFAREKLLAPFAADYRVVAEWPSFDAVDIAAEFRGLLLERVSR